jgi:hypothetical protein
MVEGRHSSLPWRCAPSADKASKSQAKQRSRCEHPEKRKSQPNQLRNTAKHHGQDAQQQQCCSKEEAPEEPYTTGQQERTEANSEDKEHHKNNQCAL